MVIRLPGKGHRERNGRMKHQYVKPIIDRYRLQDRELLTMLDVCKSAEENCCFLFDASGDYGCELPDQRGGIPLPDGQGDWLNKGKEIGS